MAAVEEKTIEGLDADDEKLILVSEEDGTEFRISRQDALMSNLVKSLLEGDSDAESIPINNVSGDTLDLIVQYLEHHNGVEPQEISAPMPSMEMERCVGDKWDAEYINKMKKKTIYEVILCANYMDIPSLLHLGCAKMATLIKGEILEKMDQIESKGEVLGSKQRAMMLKEHWEHWMGSEGKDLAGDLRAIVFKYYVDAFEWDKTHCHSDWKVTNGNKTITKSLDTGCCSVYSRNMITTKSMSRARWVLTMRGKKAGRVLVGIVDAEHVESGDTGKALEAQQHHVAVQIADDEHPECVTTEGGMSIGNKKVNWNIGDRLKLEFDLKARQCTVFLNDQLLGRLDEIYHALCDRQLPESFFCALSSDCPGIELETTLFEAW